MSEKALGGLTAVALLIGSIGLIGCGSEVNGPGFVPPEEDDSPSDTATAYLPGVPAPVGELAAVLRFEAPRV